MMRSAINPLPPMSPLTHLLIAWLIANLVATDARTRRLALIAGTIPDIDGFPVLFNQDLFLSMHHTFAHTLVFGIAVSSILALFVKKRGLGFATFICGFGAHLSADLVGSWGIPAFAPFFSTALSTSSFLPSDIDYSLLFLSVMIVVLAGTVAVLVWKKRTPVEFLSARWDTVMVGFITLPFTSRCYDCGRRALFGCDGCGRTVCGSHASGRIKRITCPECKDREESRDLA